MSATFARWQHLAVGMDRRRVLLCLAQLSSLLSLDTLQYGLSFSRAEIVLLNNWILLQQIVSHFLALPLSI